jgi:hypothetical protein
MLLQPTAAWLAKRPAHPPTVLPALPRPLPLQGFHHAFSRWAKPFNPILGETWEACLPDGCTIFLEQISHHPPISAFQLLGPRALFAFTGQRCSAGMGQGWGPTAARPRRVLLPPECPTPPTPPLPSGSLPPLLPPSQPALCEL